MLRRILACSFAAVAVSVTAGCMGEETPPAYPPPPRYLPPPPPPPEMRPDVHPKPNPQTAGAENKENKSARDSTKDEKSAEEKPKKPAGVDNKTTEKPVKAAAKGPLTPADIRSAVPVQKVKDPKGLSGAQLRSLWGEGLGRVQSVDVAGGNLTGVRVSIAVGGKPKTVRIDPANLKYVHSRNVLLTSLSRADLEKRAAQTP